MTDRKVKDETKVLKHLEYLLEHEKDEAISDNELDEEVNNNSEKEGSNNSDVDMESEINKEGIEEDNEEDEDNETEEEVNSESDSEILSDEETEYQREFCVKDSEPISAEEPQSKHGFWDPKKEKRIPIKANYGPEPDEIAENVIFGHEWQKIFFPKQLKNVNDKVI